MKTLESHLIKYAEYHRDPRNIKTHFLGITMIVIAVAMILSRPRIEFLAIHLSPFVLALVMLSIFYIRLNFLLGAMMTAALIMAGWLGAKLAQLDTVIWATISLGIFITGWIFQFIGHHYEGKKPAFLDDLTGLVIGPLFILVEFLFLLGFLSELRHSIESKAGPMRRKS